MNDSNNKGSCFLGFVNEAVIIDDAFSVVFICDFRYISTFERKLFEGS